MTSRRAREKGLVLASLWLLLSTSTSTLGQAEKSLRELREDLKKIERSIGVTKQKLKEVRDVAFIPDLYFVIAELYVEKSRYLYTIGRQSNPNVPVNEIDFSDSQKAKKSAIETYQRFIENFPNSENLDKAYFFLAHEFRELGQSEEMLRIYGKITKDFPKSKFWEESQLILGDFFLEQKKDPAQARELYQKILDRPVNPFVPLARYKVGWCYINLNKFYEAMLAFESVINFDYKISTENLPDIYKKNDLRRDALIALVWPYSEQQKLSAERQPALAYFERLIPDRITMIPVLEKLARRLTLKQRVDDALPVYWRLIEISTQVQTRLSAFDGFYEAFKKAKGNWPIDSRLTAHLMNTWVLARQSDDLKDLDRAKIEKNLEIYFRDFATNIHARAKKTSSKDGFQEAASAYEHYLTVAPRNKFYNLMVLNLAETEFALKRYSRAGAHFELLLRAKIKARRKEVFDSAVQSYALALKNSDSASKLELVEAREGFREVGGLFLEAYPRDRAGAMILFNIGRTYYDERDYDQATERLKKFISLYPRHARVTSAGQMILDGFSQREDYAGLIAAGRELIQNSRIENQTFKKDVAEIVHQGEFKKIQDQASSAKSREYAKKLLDFAAKYQGSDLGDQALYEAFMSLKAKKDPGAYAPGEQLLVKHKDSKYAREAATAMGQMALNTADYRRAAKYFEYFSTRYPQDATSPDLLKTAAKMRELMGDYSQAAQDYRDLGQKDKMTEQNVQARDWESVTQAYTGQALNSLKENYWMGLALIRQGQSDAARPYLSQASRLSGRTFDESAMAAHSLYLLASLDLKSYEAIQLGEGDESALVTEKKSKLTQLTTQMNTVIGFGNGKWTIAALYELGRSHLEFAKFLQNASVPLGLNPSQKAEYKTLISSQVSQYEAKATGFFNTCLESAEKFEIFTEFVLGCQSRGGQKVSEEVVEKFLAGISEGSGTEARSVRRKLFDSPRDTSLLVELADLYIGAQDYAMARLIVSRVLEIKPQWPEVQSKLGLILLFMNDPEAARVAFKSALKASPHQPLALYGLGGLYAHFGFKARLKSLRVKLKSVVMPQGVLHPWMTGLSPKSD